MNMKKILLSILMLFMFVAAYAQTAIETPKFLDNWYIGVGGQVSAPLDFYSVFPVNGATAVILGKQFTPVFGANFEDNTWFTSRMNGGTSARFDFSNNHNIVRGNYLGLNGTMNLMNLFGGYNGQPRLFEVQTIAGLGWFHVFTPNMSDRCHNDLAGKTGLNLLFNFKNGHGVYVQPAVLWNLTRPACHHSNVAFNKNGGQLAIQVGYVYRFKNSNGTHHFKTYDIDAMNRKIVKLQNDLAKKPKVVLKETIKTVEVPNTVTIDNTYYVFFAQNSYELTEDAKATLNNIKGTVNIIASASPEGTPKYNQTLSEKRAMVVANYLTDNGVKVNSYRGVGVTNNTSGRVAIITIQQ